LLHIDSISGSENFLIIIMNLVDLGLSVLSYVTPSLSGDSVPSVFFLDGLYPFFSGIIAVLLVLASDCFPFSLRVEASFVCIF
jgi:hypothetical protein